MPLSDDERAKAIAWWIDEWMKKLNARAKEYQAQGISPENAIDRATDDIRMEIRRTPPIDLD